MAKSPDLAPGMEAAIALSRFGLGSTTAGVSAVGDARDVLHQEISAGALVPQNDGLKATPQLLIDLKQYQAERKALRDAKPDAAPNTQMAPNAQMNGQMASQGMDTMSGSNMSGQTMTSPAMAAPPGAEVNAKGKIKPDFNPIRDAVTAESDARFNGTVKTPVIGFNERVVMFWMNHFAISTKKSESVAITLGAFEREAIRPYAFGKFSDLLLAVETHPAMLEYLDNQQSIGPNSIANRGGKRGLNENLAREIMELHTLGVGTGYTQTDVTSFAKVITGWTIDRNADANAPTLFTFNARAHEPGAKTILGKTYADEGFHQGRQVLMDLSRHPATANHIATKLARHFVSDTPPPALIAKLAHTFTTTDGDLAQVSRVLVDADESWSPRLVKVRSPLEYMCALIRCTGITLKPQAIMSAMENMGQAHWQPSGPNGYPDTLDAWASPEGLSARVDVVSALAGRSDQSLDPRAFAESRLGALLTDHTREAISRAETHAQGISLALLSPEFMRR